MTQIDFWRAPRKKFSFKYPPLINCLKSQLEKYFSGKKVNFAKIPLDLSSASGFQKKVWRKLKHIPAGKVVTYQKLAQLSGSPRASRAVGSAMKANPFPIVVACHRVIRSDGSLGGYSKGIELKKLLLAIES
ncbi:MAG: methylated-DNA--[protein]-cysteine S-methyltransferase [Candidatus Omnitrophica bacterium]|nr:methylated-DNA--[protein]-cysteine S-methyltransferase [Candidatus Omnitrophota bacterium]